MSYFLPIGKEEGLPKEERLCGKSDIAKLLHGGHFGHEGCLKFCWLFRPNAEGNRVMVSVSKRLFKKAVKRNLLKRRMREAYRTSKEIFDQSFGGCDLMLIYNSKEIADYYDIKLSVQNILRYMCNQVHVYEEES